MSAENLCGWCGHTVAAHHEPARRRYDISGGVITSTPNPAWQAGHAHCDDPACDCVRVTKVSGCSILYSRTTK